VFLPLGILGIGILVVWLILRRKKQYNTSHGT
jgi:hypothetical protein